MYTKHLLILHRNFKFQIHLLLLFIMYSSCLAFNDRS